MTKQMEFDELQRKNRRSAFRWGTFVVGFLILQLTLGFSAVVLSKSDPTVAVVPDYYQKSLDWDSRKALLAQSEGLNWHALLTCEEGTLVLRAVDDREDPIEIADVTISIYQHTRAADVRTWEINGAELDVPGQVRIANSLNCPGLWQVDVDLTDSSGQRFVQSEAFCVVGSGDGL